MTEQIPTGITWGSRGPQSRIRPSRNFAMSCSHVQLEPRLMRLTAADEIDYQTLLRVAEELFIVTAFQVLT
jgi:hypothetical protein